MKRLEKEKAIKLRFQGKSYGEIQRILNIPSKGTLSYWFKDLKLSLVAQERLKDKIDIAQKRGLFAFNRRRTDAIAVENKQVFEEARNAFSKLSPRDLFLVGVALYWGEGTKSHLSKAVVFTNSDPKMISVFMRFLREILKVSEERIRAGIQVHGNVDIQEAKKFWSRTTNLPEERFFITHQISSASKFKRPPKYLPFGTSVIKVNSRVSYQKMMGFIDGLAKVGRGSSE